MKCLVLFVFCFQLFYGAFSVSERLGCRDEAGNLIDYYYIYKLPNTFDGHGTHHSGLDYLFLTPSTSEWTLSQKLINESTSLPGKTLSEIYLAGSEANNLVMMYNDEPPSGKTDGTRGHTKGVVVANDISGFFIVHSVPKFPPPVEEDSYGYPATGSVYGQSFLCLSLTGDQIGKIGKQLQYNEPHFYSSHVPDHLKTIYPELMQALEMKPITKPPFYSIETIVSRGGVNFMSFAKSRKFQKELYEDLVAPYFDSGDYYVETWRHGPGNLDSDCTKPSKVYNIEQIEFKSANITFKTMQDHSKWMVSAEKKLLCVGDINRQEHQKVRGGGTVCQQSKISAVYEELVNAVESCKKDQKTIQKIAIVL